MKYDHFFGRMFSPFSTIPKSPEIRFPPLLLPPLMKLVTSHRDIYARDNDIYLALPLFGFRTPMFPKRMELYVAAVLTVIVLLLDHFPEFRALGLLFAYATAECFLAGTPNPDHETGGSSVLVSFISGEFSDARVCSVALTTIMVLDQSSTSL